VSYSFSKFFRNYLLFLQLVYWLFFYTP
jgi:hypothetical protein